MSPLCQFHRCGGMVPWHSLLLARIKWGVDVHMKQSGFSCNLVENVDLQHHGQTPNATPYRLGIPIGAITVADADDKLPAQN